MRSDGCRGCICTQQTQNKANRDTDRTAGHNLGKGVGGQIGCQGCRGRHMAATDHVGEYGVCEGCPGTTHAYIYGLRCIRARKNKKKNQNKQNGRALQKWPKGQKRENSIKEGKKRGKKEKEVRTRSKTSRCHAPKPNAKEKARGKH